MTKRTFICTYQNQRAFEISKAYGLLGFSTNNAGAKGSIAKLKTGDLVFIRNNMQKKSLSCFGVFEVTGLPFEANLNAPLVWQEELAQNKVIFTHRVPAQYINVNLRQISKDEILKLGWKRRVSPFNEYKWQGLSRLFSVNFFDPEQAQQLAELWGINLDILSPNDLHWQSPDEIQNSSKLIEGAKISVVVNAYERNPQARKDCIKHYGYKCLVCGFDFETLFGDIGKQFIHIHHLKTLASIGDSYVVDPIEDLRPVCPNCHAMLHKKEPPFSIDELQAIIKANVKP
jgi:predicted HNH restriction endonuclease